MEGSSVEKNKSGKYGANRDFDETDQAFSELTFLLRIVFQPM